MMLRFERKPKLNETMIEIFNFRSNFLKLILKFEKNHIISSLEFFAFFWSAKSFNVKKIWASLFAANFPKLIKMPKISPPDPFWCRWCTACSRGSSMGRSGQRRSSPRSCRGSPRGPASDRRRTWNLHFFQRGSFKKMI